MKEFIEKLIGRLERNAFPLTYNFQTEKYLKFDKAKEIVNELAEECKGGWISCSERLPKANTQVIVTAEKYGHKYTTDAYFYNGKFYNKHYYKIPVGELNDSFVGDNVLAWQPLPTPYKEEGEKNELRNDR